MIKIEDLRNIKDLSVVEGLEIKTYVPIMIKMAMIDALVGDLVQQDEYGMYVVNSMIKEVKSKMAIVALYTNIELTKAKPMIPPYKIIILYIFFAIYKSSA